MRMLPKRNENVYKLLAQGEWGAWKREKQVKVFSKKKFIEINGLDQYKRNKRWVDDADGKTREETAYILNDSYMVDKVGWASDMDCFADGHVAVRIDGKNNLEEFLSLCDERDLRFKDGSKASSVCEWLSKIIALNECVYMAHIVIGAVSWLAFSAGANVFGSCTVIDVQDMLKKERKPKKYHILIDCIDGKTTIANLLEDHKVVKSVKARCHPDDKFDFAIGAQAALDRLFGREVVKPKEKPKRKFKVGDRVKCVSDIACNCKGVIGKCGTVMDIEGYSVDVKFDKEFISVYGSKRDSWWLGKDDLIHID